MGAALLNLIAYFLLHPIKTYHTQAFVKIYDSSAVA
jgi:hypothetical protein